jgi:hypothetical protein
VRKRHTDFVEMSYKQMLCKIISLLEILQMKEVEAEE